MVDLAEYRKMKHKVEADLAQLAQERQKLDERREEIDHEIGSLEKLGANLDACLQQEEGDAPARQHRARIKANMGITDAVRAVVHAAGRKRVLPTEVRDTLVESGFGNSRNLLPEIHAALRRLAASEEFAAVKVGKKTAYRSRSMPILSAQ